MGRFLRVMILVVAAAGLAFLEVRWVGEADYADQKARAEGLFSEVAGEISMIEVGLLDGGEVEEVVMSFERDVAALEEIPYVMNERAEVMTELVRYDEGLPGQMALARELKVLRALCDGFAEKVRAEMKGRKIDAGLFREINTVFVEFGENLPEVEYASTQALVAQLGEVVRQVGVSAAAAANCVGVCAEVTMREHGAAVEKRLGEALVEIDEVNGMVREGFDSSGLVDRLK